MTTADSGMRASVVRAKSTWLDGRELIRQRHQAGGSGVEVTRAMSDLLDSALSETASEAPVLSPERIEAIVGVHTETTNTEQDAAEQPATAGESK